MATINGEDYAVEILGKAGISELVITDDGRTSFKIDKNRFFYHVTMTEEDDLVIQFSSVICEGLKPSEKLFKGIAMKQPLFASVGLNEIHDGTYDLVIGTDLIIGWNIDEDVTIISYVLRSMNIQVKDLAKKWK